MVLAGCGDESDYETEVNPLYASLAISQTAGISAAMGAASPEATANGVLSLGSAAQNIIVPVFDEETSQLRLAASVRGLPAVGDCLCDATGCHFAGCSDDAGTWTIDGDIEVSGDTYRFDVSIVQGYDSDDYTTETRMTTEGEITITATTIDGQVSGSVDTDMTYRDEDGDIRVEAWFDWNMNARQVGLDASRCAVSGSLDASVSAEAESGGRDVDYNGSGTVDFGPACGDATVAE
jgi:hypothetical protein